MSAVVASVCWIPAIVLACLVGAATARAAWLPGGTPMDTQAGDHADPRVVPDGLGGAYVVWTLSNTQVRAQHLTSSGDPAAGWSAGGQEIAFSGFAHQLLGAGPDGNGGLIAGLLEGDNGRAIRLQADGTPVSGWSAAGSIFLTVGGSTHCGASLDYFTSDFSGGGWFASDTTCTTCAEPNYCFSGGNVTLGHIDGTGAADGSWSLMVSTYRPTLRNGTTRTGGFIATGVSGDGYEINVARLTHTPQMSWSYHSYFDHNWVFGSADDGAGGALMVMEGEFSTTSPHLLRLDASGTIPTGWPADGVPLPLPNHPYLGVTTIDDGSGGILIGWRQQVGTENELRVLRMTNAGVPATGWPAEGLSLVSGSVSPVKLASDGEGGVFAVWADGRNTAPGGGLYAMHVGPDGALDPAYPVNGAMVARGGPAVDIAPVSTGRAVLAWMDHRDGSHFVVYAQQLPPLFTLDAPKLTAGGLALAGFTPNPARGAVRVGFRLAEQGDATLEVFDLLGRRVAGKELAALPAGDHSVSLDGAGSLPNGVYLIRVRAGGQERIARGLIAR